MSHHRSSFGRKIFMTVNYTIMIIASLLCFLPFLNLFAVSVSDSNVVAAGQVAFMPIGFNTAAYEFIMLTSAFADAFFVSVRRVLLGVSLNLILIVLTAYPLSKMDSKFKARTFYAWFFFFTMLFAPSLIPSFMVVRYLGLLDSIWALVLPGAVPVFSVVVMLNFFRNLPKSLEEAAHIDGAGHFKILFSIFIPLSKPAIATLALFSIVGHWNAWFDGMIFMNTPANLPLQSYLQTIVVNPAAIMRVVQPSEELARILMAVNNRTSQAAQLFVAMIPILIIYPFLQKYFTTGLVIGSVKE